MDGGEDLQLSLRTNATISGLSLSNRVGWRRSELSGRHGPTETLDTAAVVAGSIGPVRLRAGFDYTILPNLTARRLRGEASYRLSNWFISFIADRDLRTGGGQFALLTNRDWNGVRLGADIRYDDRTSDWRGALTLSLAIDRDPIAGGPRFGRSALGNRGSLLAVPFLDRDNNGRRDLHEPLISDVAIATTPRGLSRMDEARILVENLPVDQQTAVRFALDDLGDPYLVVPVRGYMVSTRPGALTEIEIPLVQSGELEVLLTDVDGAGIQNKIVTVRDCETREIVARERTAFDGRAFFRSIIPGCLKIEAAGSEKEIEVVAGEVLEITLPPDK